ncbi:hypothetical protein cypCar_00013985 [Cyprinus carpio]|nr:hypothetical protein cypCar_00013985 [Cyprinus carpio]
MKRGREQSHAFLSVVQGCASSISTKYQTIIISKEEKKGFSSQSKRFQDHLAGHVARSFQRLSPGPDAYNLQTSLLHKHEFNRGESRMFRLPVAVKREEPKN